MADEEEVPAIADENQVLEEPPPLEEEAPPEPARPAARNPDKLVLYKHWVKPRRTAYNYIYDYRRVKMNERQKEIHVIHKYSL